MEEAKHQQYRELSTKLCHFVFDGLGIISKIKLGDSAHLPSALSLPALQAELQSKDCGQITLPNHPFQNDFRQQGPRVWILELESSLLYIVDDIVKILHFSIDQWHFKHIIDLSM